MAIQSDALRNAAIDADELRREIEVIIEEAKRKQDTPSAVAQETLHALLYDHHRIRRWRIGTEPVLRSFTRDDVVGLLPQPVRPLADHPQRGRRRSTATRSWRWPSDCTATGPPGAPAVDRSPVGAAAPGAARRDAPRGRSPVRPDRGMARRAGAPSRRAAARPCGRGAFRRPRRLALSRASGHRNRGLGRGVQLLARRRSASSQSRPTSSRTGCEAALPAIAGRGRPAGHGRARRPKTWSGPARCLRARWARRFETAEGRASELAAAESHGGLHLVTEEYEALLRLTGDGCSRGGCAATSTRPSVSGRGLSPARCAGEDLTAGHLGARLRPVPPDGRRSHWCRRASRSLRRAPSPPGRTGAGDARGAARRRPAAPPPRRRAHGDPRCLPDARHTGAPRPGRARRPGGAERDSRGRATSMARTWRPPWSAWAARWRRP